jgi:drug/metabolite transporter (DMT)-like permease
MGKINWTRVLLGGLIAGVVANVLQFAVWVPLVGRSLNAALETLGHPMQETVGTTVLMVVLIFVAGILAIWLYAAIRPRYGAGPGTAALAGIAAGLLMGVFPDIAWGLMLRLIPARVWVMDAVFSLVVIVIATMLGAWVYKEQAP